MKNTLELQTNIFTKIYRSVLASGSILEIDQIVLPFQNMKPLLHEKANSEEFDLGAFVYSSTRLPAEILEVENVCLIQMEKQLAKDYFLDFKKIEAKSRRRRMYFSREKKELVVFINSVTDVDDFVSLCTSFQLEVTKLGKALKLLTDGAFQKIREEEDFLTLEKSIFNKEDKIFREKLIAIYDKDAFKVLEKIRKTSLNLKLMQKDGNFNNYRKSVDTWLEKIVRKTDLNLESKIYFVSSNAHSLINCITGFAKIKEKFLVDYIFSKNIQNLIDIYKSLENSNDYEKENFLWHILKIAEKEYPELIEERIEYQKKYNFVEINSSKRLDINVQIIKLNNLVKNFSPENFSENLDSNAYILNIDYPLGFGAYLVLNALQRYFKNVLGVYILSKASFFHGKLGEIAIPTQIFDEHSKNTYMIDNCFKRNNKFIENYHRNQLAFSTKGTYLHSREMLNEKLKKGYTIMEMENGPYINAVFENTNYRRYPENKLVNMTDINLDLGIINYASDTPFTKAITLGTKILGFEGVSCTYNASREILNRILDLYLKS